VTVTTGNDRRADAVGNGSLLVFAYDFLILANTDIKVYHVDAAGLSTLLTLTTDYTVSGVGTSGGGNITLTSAYAVAGTPAATESILMLGETAKTQETDLLQNGAYNAEVQEAIGDKLTLIANEHERERDRSLRLALSDSAVTVSTLLPVQPWLKALLSPPSLVRRLVQLPLLPLRRPHLLVRQLLVQMPPLPQLIW
tara:strand:- start:90 stop:680 length:591 start_codon:yes stop_codon:yes gene_type:complete